MVVIRMCIKLVMVLHVWRPVPFVPFSELFFFFSIEVTILTSTHIFFLLFSGLLKVAQLVLLDFNSLFACYIIKLVQVKHL